MKGLRAVGGLAAASWLACAGPPPATLPPVDRAPGAEPVAVRFALPAAAELASVPARVVFVSIAGLSARAYRSPDGLGSRMPNLAALAEAGASADAVVPVTPASPGPVHATLATGRTPAAHGIGSDRPLRAKGTDAARYREATAIRVPALWQLARAAGASTALIGWPTSVGAAADWVYPELFPARLGEASPELLEGRATPALLAAARRLGADRPEAGFPGPARDEILAGLTCELLAGPSPPRLTLLRLSQTEAPLERVGPVGPELAAAFAGADAALGRVLSCLADAGRLAETAFVVTGDVPVAPVHTLIQPNVALAAAGLIVPGPRSRTGISRWDAVARSNGTSAFVYARDSETALLARRALREAARVTLAFRIVSAEEMLALGADREAWFGLEAFPGHAFGDGLRGDSLVIPSAARGAWGALGGVASREVGFVAWGSGVRGPIRIPELRQTDVAPSVARLLGIALPDADGRALVGVMHVPPAGVGAPPGPNGAR